MAFVGTVPDLVVAVCQGIAAFAAADAVRSLIRGVRSGTKRRRGWIGKAVAQAVLLSHPFLNILGNRSRSFVSYAYSAAC
jgi:hypothetical protein